MRKIFFILIYLSIIIGCNNVNEPVVKPDYSNPTIGIYSDEGAHPSCVSAAKLMFEWMGYNTKNIFASDLNENSVSDITIFYFPGGSTGGYRTKINDKGRDVLRERISSGCAYIGTCAGALIAFEKNLWEGYNDNEGLFNLCPGTAVGPIPEIYQYPEIGMCRINFTENSNEITSEKDLWILYYNGPYFTSEDPKVTVIANYEISNNPAIVSTTYGSGRVFLTGPHPEFEEDSDRDGETYFDQLDDQGSDWPFMKNVVKWCLKTSE